MLGLSYRANIGHYLSRTLERLRACDTRNLLVHFARQVTASQHRNARTGDVYSVAKYSVASVPEAVALNVIVKINVIQVIHRFSVRQVQLTALKVLAGVERAITRLGR